jgi:uncharacterized membrane protein/nitrite reductase/ring-hydroxylating ferredoxin subunit
MRSKAHIKSHPIHPILVSFPIAFFIGSFLADLAGYCTGNADLSRTGYWLQIAGIGFALLAAVPGIIDFLFAVPPKSSGKKRALTHGLLNVTNVLIFAGVWFYRRQENPSVPLILGAELIGIIILSIAGWMGGTLAYRNQIGVDHRYANAGKWKEEHFNSKQTSLDIGKIDQLKINQMKLLHVGTRRIVLARTEENYVAFDDHCSHRGGSLADGAIICGTVQCPWHGSQFDCKTGEVKAGPAKQKIPTYQVTESNGKIFLNL